MSALRSIAALFFISMATTMAMTPAAQSQILVEYDADPLAGGFLVTSRAECALGAVRVVIDLSGSEGALTFEPGATVARTDAGPQRVATAAAGPTIAVTDEVLTLDAPGLAPGRRIAIRARLASDYDEDEIMLFDRPEALIAGAEAVTATPGGAEHVGLFGADGRAVVDTDACRF